MEMGSHTSLPCLHSNTKNNPSPGSPVQLEQLGVMSQFAEDFTTFKPPVTFMEMDPSLEFVDDFPELHAGSMENPSLGLMGFSSDGFLPQQPEFPAAYVDGLPGFLPAESPAPALAPPQSVAAAEERQTSKRKHAVAAVDGASVGSSMPGQEGSRGGEEKAKKKDSARKGKRGRCSEKEEGKSKEVVHVRARRGQATDSHSLAERVRREKINEKMRCLQGLVPGCYKAMGMAVMLDEIINYVQSLQNQVEFLSMKLSVASAVYDFNLDLDATTVNVMPQVLPRVGEVDEAQEVVDRQVRGGGHEGCTSFYPTVPF